MPRVRDSPIRWRGRRQQPPIWQTSPTRCTSVASRGRFVPRSCAMAPVTPSQHCARRPARGRRRRASLQLARWPSCSRGRRAVSADGARAVRTGTDVSRRSGSLCSACARSVGAWLRPAPADPGTADAEARMRQPLPGLVSLFAVEIALARQLVAWGLKPQVLLGHSLGEYAAACLAEVFALDDALALVAKRGALLQTLPRGGSMLSVAASAESLQPLLRQGLTISAKNRPGSCTIWIDCCTRRAGSCPRAAGRLVPRGLDRCGRALADHRSDPASLPRSGAAYAPTAAAHSDPVEPDRRLPDRRAGHGSGVLGAAPAPNRAVLGQPEPAAARRVSNDRRGGPRQRSGAARPSAYELQGTGGPQHAASRPGYGARHVAAPGHPR